MKKKSDSTKVVKAPSEKRKRRTNLELAGFSRRHLTTVKRISDESRVPLEQVFGDIIENGLISVMPLYESMIAFRKSRETKLKTMFSPKQNELPPAEPTGPGITEEQDELVTIEHRVPAESQGFPVRDTNDTGFSDGPSDDDERSGLAGAHIASSGSHDTNGETSTGD
jgi:hypothetical protein